MKKILLELIVLAGYITWMLLFSDFSKEKIDTIAATMILGHFLYTIKQ